VFEKGALTQASAKITNYLHLSSSCVESFISSISALVRWANYFCLGPVSKAYRAVDRHARKRLRQWLCAKHKMAGRATRKYPEATLHTAFGLICLSERTHSFSWAKP
jgi:hypothetical protein